jgi:transposase
MGKIRKKHSPQFKAKVALAAIQNDETIAQIASRFGVHPNMVSAWKRQMLEGAADIFDKNGKIHKQTQAETNELYRQIANSRLKTIFYHASSSPDQKATGSTD